VAPPRAHPELPALQDTHTGAALLHVIKRSMGKHTDRRTLRHLPGSRIEVQSVTFGDDTTAWLETCLVTDVEDRTEQGDVLPGDFFETGTITTQQTDVMRHEDGVWKLAESIVNHVADGRRDCAVGDAAGAAGDELHSEAAISRAREAAEDALVDLVNTKDCCALKPKDLEPFAKTHTGQLLNQYRFRLTSERHLDQPAEDRAVRYVSSSDCVIYPGTSLPPKPPGVRRALEAVRRHRSAVRQRVSRLRARTQHQHAVRPVRVGLAVVVGRRPVGHPAGHRRADRRLPPHLPAAAARTHRRLTGHAP
jgi:hypothetical protein